MRIDQMKSTDWECVKAIYCEGIETKNATFETEPPTFEKWDHKYLSECRLVARDNEKLAGWAAVLPTSQMKAYEGVVELSLYVAKDYLGKGVGSALLQAMITESEANGLWILQSVIFPENTASIRLHKKYGFEEIGTRKKVGKLNGIWRDVVLLERRSEIVGIE